MPSFRHNLMDWYRRNRRNLPWRRTHNPYRIWISEVMLQQTQASTVAPYYERFLKAFPTVESLARAPKDRLMKLWEGLGYYARARNLREAARRVVAEHGGRIPRDPETFSALPGAGPYTTAAVLSIAFGVPLAAIDGNVRRVIARLFDISRVVKPDDDEIRSRAQRLMEGRQANLPLPLLGKEGKLNFPPYKGRIEGGSGFFNQAMMELGATVCTPKRPACLLCPVRTFCEAFKNETVSQRPVPAARRTKPHRQVVAAILKKNGRVLIGRRPDEGLLGGLWEFPGGKVEPGESPEEALRREMQEELGIDTIVGKSLTRVDHAYTHFSITLSGHLCEFKQGAPKPLAHSELRWVRPAQLGRFAMPEANRKLLREIQKLKII